MAGEVMFIKWISWKHCEIGSVLKSNSTYCYHLWHILLDH